MKARALFAAMLLALLVSGCKVSVTSGDSPSPETEATTSDSSPAAAGLGKTVYSGNGVTFSYPDSFEETTLGETTASNSTPNWQVAFGDGGDVNLVIVGEYTLAAEVTPENLTEVEPGITESIQSLAESAGGAFLGGPGESSMGNLPALEYEISISTPDGTPVQSHLVLGFDGATQYLVNCQYTLETKGTVMNACQNVVESFQIT